jgi:hypothetical protein
MRPVLYVNAGTYHAPVWVYFEPGLYANVGTWHAPVWEKVPDKAREGGR